jgi:hypothetical protein
MVGTCVGFSLAGYRSLLQSFIDLGYESADYFTIRPNEKTIIFRHDIDFALGPAVKIAEIESEMGIQSTFFVLVSTEFYNLFSKENRVLLARLQGLGHRIGLHFDRSVHSGDLSKQEKAARIECSVLENLIGSEVLVTAFHLPAQSPEVLGRPGLFADRIHAYAPEFFTDIGYVSDGAGFWSHGHPLQHPSVANGSSLQLLTHPYLWDGEYDASPLERIQSVISKRQEFLLSEYRRNLLYFPREDL